VLKCPSAEAFKGVVVLMPVPPLPSAVPCIRAVAASVWCCAALAPLYCANAVLCCDALQCAVLA
jgi:hypothetical protein